MYSCEYYLHACPYVIQRGASGNLLGTNLKSTEQKTDSVFSIVRECLHAAYFFIQSASELIYSIFTPNIFEGKLLTSTYNGGRPSDALEYAKYQYAPCKVPEDKEKQLAAAGYTQEQAYFDPECAQLAPTQGIFLSPIPVDKGKCHGGVTLFLQKALSGETEVEIAQQFASGIPLEGVLHQELAKKIWVEMGTKRSSSLLAASNDEMIIQNPRDRAILQGYNQYFDFKEQNPDSLDPIEWVDHYIQGQCCLKEPLDDAEKATLYHIESMRYKTRSNERLSLAVQGLEIEPLKTDFDGNPDEILRSAPNLKPGAYKLNFPAYNIWGSHRGFHTVGFVIHDNGSTTFYDPNYSITEVTKEKRQRAIKKLFRHYTGYSKSQKNSLFRQIKHALKGHANPPEEGINPTGFNLLKIKAASNTKSEIMV